MKRKVFIPLLTVLLLTGFSGCKKENNAPGEIKQPDVAQNGELIHTPEGLKKSSDPMAQQVISLFSNLNMVGNYMKLFSPPAGATSFPTEINGAVAYTWSDGSVTYWLIYYETNDKYVWKLDADFGSGRNKYAYIEESIDEKSGQADFYIPGYNDIHATWSYDNNDNLTFEVTYQSSEGSIKIDAVENHDGSGSLNYYLNGKLTISAQWKDDGSGSWIIYTENGELTGQWSSGK